MSEKTAAELDEGRAEMKRLKTAFVEACAKLATVPIPRNYDLTMNVIRPLTEYVAKFTVYPDMLLTMASAMYNYGFKRGVACEKARARNKRKEEKQKQQEMTSVDLQLERMKRCL